jgi:Flp pilus assembly protein TadG
VIVAVGRRLGRRLGGRLVAAGHRDRGAAVAEFAMISVLLLLLLFGVLQVAVYFYVRNIVAASAADGARYAADDGVPPAAGADRASLLLRQAAAAGVAREISCRAGAGQDPATGLVEAVVRCRGALTLTFLPVRMPLTVDVSARSLKEQPP